MSYDVARTYLATADALFRGKRRPLRYLHFLIHLSSCDRLQNQQRLPLPQIPSRDQHLSRAIRGLDGACNSSFLDDVKRVLMKGPLRYVERCGRHLVLTERGIELVGRVAPRWMRIVGALQMRMVGVDWERFALLLWQARGSPQVAHHAHRLPPLIGSGPTVPAQFFADVEARLGMIRRLSCDLEGILLALLVGTHDPRLLTSTEARDLRRFLGIYKRVLPLAASNPKFDQQSDAVCRAEETLRSFEQLLEKKVLPAEVKRLVRGSLAHGRYYLHWDHGLSASRGMRQARSASGSEGKGDAGP